jgi:hypothetical protein
MNLKLTGCQLRRDKEKGIRDKGKGIRTKNPPKNRIMVKVYKLLFLVYLH